MEDFWRWAHLKLGSSLGQASRRERQSLPTELAQLTSVTICNQRKFNLSRSQAASKPRQRRRHTHDMTIYDQSCPTIYDQSCRRTKIL